MIDACSYSWLARVYVPPFFLLMEAIELLPLDTVASDALALLAFVLLLTPIVDFVIFERYFIMFVKIESFLAFSLACYWIASMIMASRSAYKLELWILEAIKLLWFGCSICESSFCLYGELLLATEGSSSMICPLKII